MTEDDKDHRREPGIKTIFQNALNLGGYPFQYAVIRRACELFDTHPKESVWNFVASEFPVVVQGYNTCIDFILSHWPQNGSCGFLVAECKRANPALKNWLFAKAPYVRRNNPSPILLLEQVKRFGNAFFPSVGSPGLAGSDVYHIAIEVKSKVPGNPVGNRKALDEAATQVMRGVNGIIEVLSKHPAVLKDDGPPAFFLPVIFTTAALWSTDADISSANLKDGEISLSDMDVISKPWLWLQYPVSPTLKHSLGPSEFRGRRVRTDTLEVLIDQEFTRTIAIVSSTGIDAFLCLQHWWE